MDEKKSIRKDIFAKRKEYTQEQVWEMSQKIAEKLVKRPEYQKADKILAYIDCKKEACTKTIIETAWADGKKVGVPKIEGKDMIFYEITSYDQLELGYFDIMEPVESCPKAQWDDALMIMPGVAFDRNRHRVGYGGGFYDRYLEKHDIPKIAIALSFQVKEAVPVEPTDILPDAIITDTEIIE